jgi:hypothetical protein
MIDISLNFLLRFLLFGRDSTVGADVEWFDPRGGSRRFTTTVKGI